MIFFFVSGYYFILCVCSHIFDTFIEGKGFLFVYNFCQGIQFIYSFILNMQLFPIENLQLQLTVINSTISFPVWPLALNCCKTMFPLQTDLFFKTNSSHLHPVCFSVYFPFSLVFISYTVCIYWFLLFNVSSCGCFFLSLVICYCMYNFHLLTCVLYFTLSKPRLTNRWMNSSWQVRGEFESKPNCINISTTVNVRRVFIFQLFSTKPPRGVCSTDLWLYTSTNGLKQAYTSPEAIY
jgi:hypothetical protein